MVPKAIRKNLMVDYLNDKYTDDHFEFLHFFGGKPWSYELLAIMCSTEKYPDKYVKVIYSPEDDVYVDNYIAIKYIDKLDEYIDKTGKTLFPDKRTKHSLISDEDHIANLSVDNLSADASFDEYLSRCREAFQIFCEYDSNELEKDKPIIEDKIKKYFLDNDVEPSSVNIIFTCNFDRDIDDIRRNHDNSLFVCFDYSNGKKAIKDVRWEK